MSKKYDVYIHIGARQKRDAEVAIFSIRVQIQWLVNFTHLNLGLTDRYQNYYSLKLKRIESSWKQKLTVAAF